jgi:DNA-binding NtrC family response regulator
MSGSTTQPARRVLDGCRVLIVEDEYFLADDLKKELESCGAKVVGPNAELHAAQAQISRDGFDVAAVDVDLRGEFAWPVADELIRENIPFGFFTGYGAEAVPPRFRHVIRLEKPCDPSKVADDIRLLCVISKKVHPNRRKKVTRTKSLI